MKIKKAAPRWESPLKTEFRTLRRSLFSSETPHSSHSFRVIDDLKIRGPGAVGFSIRMQIFAGNLR